VIEAINLQAEDAEWNPVFGERCQTFAEVELEEAAIGSARVFVQAALGNGSSPVAVRVRCTLLHIKAPYQESHCTVGVPEGGDVETDGKGSAIFMAQGNSQFPRTPILARFAKRTLHSTGGTALLVALQQNVVTASMAQDVVAQVTGDLFGTLVPKQNGSVSIHDIDRGRQVIQNGTEDFWVLQF
jgi:hypothetical protein